MKTLNLGLLLGWLAFVAGCASPLTPVTLQTIGPEPHVFSRTGEDGCLTVYSAWATSAFIDRHSPYSLVSRDGKMNQSVKNILDKFDVGPTQIQLSAGVYEVSALAAHVGRVIVPVWIKPGQTTFVYLDGSSHIVKSKNDDELVRLPNGDVAGWRSQ